MPYRTAMAHQTSIGFGTETQYGVAVPRTKFIDFTSEGFKHTNPRIESNSVRQRRRFATQVRYGNKTASGSIETEATVLGQLFFYKHGIGQLISQLVANSTLAYKHLVTPAEFLQSLSSEVHRDKGTYLYKGVKISSIKLSGSQGGNLMLSVSFIGSGEVELLGVPSVPVYPANNMNWIFSDLELKLDGSADALPIKSFEITVTNSFDQTRYQNRVLYELPETGKQEFAGKIVTGFEGTTNQKKFMEGTPASLICTAKGRRIEGEIFEQLKITIPYLLYDGEDPNVGGPDTIDENLPFTMYHNGSDPEMTIEIINTESAA